MPTVSPAATQSRTLCEKRLDLAVKTLGRTAIENERFLDGREPRQRGRVFDRTGQKDGAAFA